MAEAKPVQQPANRRTVHDHIPFGQFQAQFVQRQIAVLLNPLPDPRAMITQFPDAPIALALRRQRSGLALHDNHIVHEPRRNPEMRRRRTVCVTIFHKSNNTLTQLNRMRSAHRRSPSIRKENQISDDLGILNHINRDAL